MALTKGIHWRFMVGWGALAIILDDRKKLSSKVQKRKQPQKTEHGTFTSCSIYGVMRYYSEAILRG